ncbi:MAG: response regulator transcription factor [Oscillospiraceae bacterium]|nr:response regulator transcription factor [Oscillospiraceae bacterium]
MRILVAEDERDMNQIIVRRLTWEGYSVDACYDGQDALEYLYGAQYDCVILDVMMPKLDGFGVVKAMRDRGDETPVLFLTARDTLQDKVQGLDLGGDDYLVKPFQFEELLARLRAMTRRKDGQRTNLYTCADLEVDPARHKVTRGGREIQLAAKEYALLEYLIRNKGIVVSREQIETNLWSYDYTAGSNVVDVYIRLLRKKIDEGQPEKLIHTVRGYGYVLKEGRS